MSAGNGHGGPGAGVVVTVARPVVLVRFRPGVAGETARTVHVVPLPAEGRAGAVSALCGAVLMLEDIEIVRPGEGMPCTACVVHRMKGTTPTGQPPAGGPESADAVGRGAGGVAYQEWDWPVTLHRDQVRLSLDGEVSALAIPVPLAIEATRILGARGCSAPVLAHPYAPEHRIVLTGERYGVTLPCPTQVHRLTGVLLLPPTATPRGPISWIQPPQPDSLRGCREIDLFGALRTALHDSPAGNPSPGGDPP
ncbi:MAG: hypothetical protein ACRDUV_25000 [Pseudonocardiaceae bacterium]